MFDLFGNGDRGFFGDAFDLNFDGHLDPLERVADFGAFMQMVEEDETDDYEVDEYAEDDW